LRQISRNAVIRQSRQEKNHAGVGFYNGGFALGNEKLKAEIAAMLVQRVERLRDRDSPRFPS